MSTESIVPDLRDYLAKRGGKAQAGEAIAAMLALGHSRASVQRIAGTIVDRERSGAVYTWHLRGETQITEVETQPVDSETHTDADDPQETALYQLGRSGRTDAIRARGDLEAYWDEPELTDVEQVALLMSPIEPPAPAAVRKPGRHW